MDSTPEQANMMAERAEILGMHSDDGSLAD
jgi:hypothetical protein